MIPQNGEEIKDIVIKNQPSYTYQLHIKDELIEGNTNGKQAIQQAIYKILNTQRYENVIYSWNYGIELKDLFGRSYGYVCSELPGRIIEALTQDDRIHAVENFLFTRKKGTVSVTFTAVTTEGKIESGLEVEI